MTSYVQEITSEQELKSVLQSYPIIVMTVYGHWCGPCKALAPKFEQLAQKYSGSPAGFCKVDSESKLVNVRALPTILFYANGMHVHSIEGADINAIETTVSQIITHRAQSAGQSARQSTGQSQSSLVNTLAPSQVQRPENPAPYGRAKNSDRKYSTYGTYSK